MKPFFQGIGYIPDKSEYIVHMWALRHIYHEPKKSLHVDVFFDKLSMCHTIILTGRLELDFPTISLADLLLGSRVDVGSNNRPGPQLGGRIFGALDKTNNYDFFYRQHVVKPALIGLFGAWISGGVEWNIPHHHRASTFIPVQYRLEEHADGSKTVWVGELEVRHRMRWAVGYTLRPGVARLEADVRILNRTPLVNTMLAFANVAVHANENYQIIFPPGTDFVTQHAKREFSRWPISDNVYNNIDFRKGVVYANAEKPRGGSVNFNISSVGATENVLMAAALQKE
jgi:hypothetical protein